MLEYQFRPLNVWPGSRTSRPRRSQFSAPSSSTMNLLERELLHLSARNIVIQAAVEERDIRNDGMLRATCRPRMPGIVLSFDSKHGALMYPADAFDNWLDNLRAIALSLQALRSVDRYGVTRRAEQYTGWKALPSPTSNGHLSLEQAREFLSGIVGRHVNWSDSSDRVNAFRVVARKTHPDLEGGDESLFKKVQSARETIEAHYG